VSEREVVVDKPRWAVRFAKQSGEQPAHSARFWAPLLFGALTPPAEIARLAHNAGALFLLDTVTSLGGCNVAVDSWGVDAVYSGTQKCLSAPPGLAPISMNYALHEALRLAMQEGLEARWRRHEKCHLQLKAGLEELGLKLTAQEGHRLWQLNAVGVPPDVDEAAVRKRLLTEFNIEIGAGLGPLNGKVWRIGLMGETARPANVTRLLEALTKLL